MNDSILEGVRRGCQVDQSRNDFDEDIINGSEFAWDPKYLVCVSPATHRAIHYQESKNRLPLIAQRSPNDTSPWRNNK